MRTIPFFLIVAVAIAQPAESRAETTPQDQKALVARAQQAIEQSTRDAEQKVADLKAHRDQLDRDNDPDKVAEKLAKVGIGIVRDIPEVTKNYGAGEKGALKNGETATKHAKSFVNAYGDTLDFAERRPEVTKERAELNRQIKAAEQNLSFNQKIGDYLANLAANLNTTGDATLQNASSLVGDAQAARGRLDAREARQREARQRSSEGRSSDRNTHGPRGTVDTSGEISLSFRSRD